MLYRRAPETHEFSRSARCGRRHRRYHYVRFLSTVQRDKLPRSPSGERAQTDIYEQTFLRYARSHVFFAYRDSAVFTAFFRDGADTVRAVAQDNGGLFDGAYFLRSV